MRLTYAGFALVFATALCLADTITLTNGNVLHGTYLGGTARQVRVDLGDRIETVDVTDITRIEFRSATPASPAPAAAPVPPTPDRPVLRRESNVMRPDPPPPPPQPAPLDSVQLPAGTNFVIRMIDGVDSDQNRVGQSFAASLDQPVMLNGEVVIPRGADVTVKLVDAKQSGKLTGRAELALSLQSIKVNGRMTDLNTQTVTQESASQTGRT